VGDTRYSRSIYDTEYLTVFWSEPFGHTWVVVCHVPTDFYIPPVYNVDGD